MRIAFVGSNPSHAGPDSPAIQNLSRWMQAMQLNVGYSFYNVSTKVTPGNRPLKKSEFELDRLKYDLRGAKRVVALGATASEALTLIGVEHFRLPHPSPKNRALNDKRAIEEALLECRQYLENAYVDIDG